MKSKVTIPISLLCAAVLLFYLVYRPKPIAQNLNKVDPDLITNIPKSLGKELGLQKARESNKSDRSMSSTINVRQAYLDDFKLIEIALERAKNGAEIPVGLAPKITYKGDVAEIVWLIAQSSDKIYPRGEYYALVEIDRKSGDILKLLGSP